MTFTTLIQVEDLAANLDDPDFVVFDCRHDLTDPQYGKRVYEQSHLPRARFASVDKALSAKPTGRNGRHPLPDAETFASWLGSMGVNNSTQVVGYDDAGGLYGARLWWMLRWLGHDRVAVLDGGWAAWLEKGHPVTDEITHPQATSFRASPRNVSVDADYVLANLESNRMLVVDARSNDRFHGQNETIDPVGGHIPGATNRLFKTNVDDRGFFRTPSELRAEFTELLGDTPVQNVVHQCGSGVSACHNLLAMEVAGMDGSKLYPGSWSEWVADPSRPIATD